MEYFPQYQILLTFVDYDESKCEWRDLESKPTHHITVSSTGGINTVEDILAGKLFGIKPEYRNFAYLDDPGYRGGDKTHLEIFVYYTRYKDQIDKMLDICLSYEWFKAEKVLKKLQNIFQEEPVTLYHHGLLYQIKGKEVRLISNINEIYEKELERSARALRERYNIGQIVEMNKKYELEANDDLCQ